MGPEVDMSEKIDNVMDVSSVNIKENCNNNTMKLPEEKMIVCASNCEDQTFVETIPKTLEENLVMACSSKSEDHTFVETIPKTLEENSVMACASNSEDNAFHMEVDCDQGMVSKGCNEDVEVDIMENVDDDEEIVVERESLDPDATESSSSSSFGYTDSESETAWGASDAEVESEVRVDNTALIELDGFGNLFRPRKKKLTSHWIKFTRQVRWRCKWVELRLNELSSQESKYNRELAEYDRRKQYELDKCADGDLAIKTAPFVYQNQSRRVMKRKKRKRVEETTDLASYSACHSLFSYFASKRASGDSAYLDDDNHNTGKTSGEFGVKGECSLLDFKDCDAFEDILRKIEVAHSHARQLRARVDKFVRETAEKFTPVNASLAQHEPLGNGGPSSFLANVNGEHNFPMTSMPTTSQQNKIVLPESGVSHHREVKPLPDTIVTTDQPGKCDKTENRVPVNNLSVKEEVNNTAAFETQHTEQPQSGIEVKTELLEHVPDPNSPSKMSVNQDKQPVKVRSKLNTTPKNKRKRGRRKARASRWSKRSSG